MAYNKEIDQWTIYFKEDAYTDYVIFPDDDTQRKRIENTERYCVKRTISFLRKYSDLLQLNGPSDNLDQFYSVFATYGYTVKILWSALLSRCGVKFI